MIRPCVPRRLPGRSTSREIVSRSRVSELRRCIGRCPEPGHAKGCPSHPICPGHNDGGFEICARNCLQRQGALAGLRAGAQGMRLRRRRRPAQPPLLRMPVEAFLSRLVPVLSYSFRRSPVRSRRRHRQRPPDLLHRIEERRVRFAFQRSDTKPFCLDLGFGRCLPPVLNVVNQQIAFGNLHHSQNRLSEHRDIVALPIGG